MDLPGVGPRCLQLVLERLGGAEPVAQPLPLLGSAADCDQTVPQLQALRPRLLEQLPDHAQQAAQVDHLIASYGLRAEEVIHHAQQPGELEPLSEVVPIARRVALQHRSGWATTSVICSAAGAVWRYWISRRPPGSVNGV